MNEQPVFRPGAMRSIRAAWREAQRSRRPARDRHDECDRCVGLFFRHKITGQIRQVRSVEDGVVIFDQFEGGLWVGRPFKRSLQAALAWLHNTETLRVGS